MTPDHTQLKKLLEPFPPEAIGQLPKGNTTLSYVGHAATTKRLLEVDPEWNWEPMALNDLGLPQYDNAGGLWIKLTICGVTRHGYGDGPDPKQRVGDAIRNAAMRFGVALDLWAKEDISETLKAPWWVDLGWDSEKEHDDFRAHVKTTALPFVDRWAKWWNTEKLGWPLPKAEQPRVEAKLAELNQPSLPGVNS